MFIDGDINSHGDSSPPPYTPPEKGQICKRIREADKQLSAMKLTETRA